MNKALYKQRSFEAHHYLVETTKFQGLEATNKMKSLKKMALTQSSEIITNDC